MIPAFYWIPAFLYAILIFSVSHQSQPLAPEISEFTPDYVLHFFEYGVFAVTLLWGGTTGFKKILCARYCVWAGVVASIYAATDEFHQSFIPSRQPSIRDWVTDVFGAFVFVLTLYFYWKRRQQATQLGSG